MFVLSSSDGRITYSSPAIGSDGIIYIGSDDKYLYAIGTSTPACTRPLILSPTYTATQMNNICINCTAGYYYSNSSSTCKACPYGSNSTAGSFSCSCGSDYTSYGYGDSLFCNKPLPATSQLQLGAPWPMFRRNQYGNSISPFNGSATNTLKWKFQTSEYI